ncbi:hypothetical protein E2C01_008393 [Portunus trituberculatus]|uniref:Uncharacterized protein n=1 Tax=Portunus trituberculatus TaxID=210409 RepID=A0A5B7D3W8_PORTR|nr:hypothetical protein [Portunus trituberculatus]
MLYTTVREATNSPHQLRAQSRGESKPSMLCLTRIAEPSCISSLELISEGIFRFHSLRRPKDLSPLCTRGHHSPLLLALRLITW